MFHLGEIKPRPKPGRLIYIAFAASFAITSKPSALYINCRVFSAVKPSSKQAFENCFVAASIIAAKFTLLNSWIAVFLRLS
jgi:hypothetical protein